MIIDARRFIIVELMHTQGVQMICLDCNTSSGYTCVVHEWPHEGASLMELMETATEHEGKVH